MAKDDKKYIEEDLNRTFDERQAVLESFAQQALLVELFNAKKAEVFENMVFEGKRRYYVEDLTERDYLLENTTPYQLDILGHVIQESAWGVLLCKASKLLLNLFPSFRDNILSFKCQWSKQAMFTPVQKTNFKSVEDDLYINCNHTALHSCWFLQDLLDFFEIDKSTVVLLIHRPCGAEPKRVKEYIEKRFKRHFTEYLSNRYGKTMEYSNKAIMVIERYLNPMLTSISRSYTNLFLFDDNATLSNYIKKIREMINNNLKFDDKAKRTLNKYLDYLYQFYKTT